MPRHIKQSESEYFRLVETMLKVIKYKVFTRPNNFLAIAGVLHISTLVNTKIECIDILKFC